MSGGFRRSAASLGQVAALWRPQENLTVAIFGPPCTEVRSPGERKGPGLYAVRSLPAFAEILRDPPAILMIKPTDDLPELYDQFLQLSEQMKTKCLALSYPSDPDGDTTV